MTTVESKNSYRYCAISRGDQEKYWKRSDGRNDSNGMGIGFHVISSSDSDLEDDHVDALLNGVTRFGHKLSYESGHGQGKYSKRCKHCFCLCTLVLCVSLIMVGISVYLSMHRDRTTDAHNYCTSRSCVLAAAGIANSLDESVDPCDDFFQFACGGWKKMNPIPSGLSYYDAFDKQDRWIKKALKSLLEEDCSTCNKNSSEYKAKLLYKTCNDLGTINRYGVEPLKILVEKFGGLSLSGSWNRSNFDLSRLVGGILRHDVGVFFKIDVESDLTNSSENIAQIFESGLTLKGQGYYSGKTLDDPTLAAYLDYMTDVAVLLGGERNDSKRVMTDVLLFETKLAAIQTPRDIASTGRNYRHFTLAEIQKLSPAFDWLNITNAIFSQSVPDPIEKSEVIGTKSAGYLRNLSQLIRNTSLETLNDYMIWHLANSFLPGCGEDYLLAINKFEQEIYRTGGGSCHERWRWCVSFVLQNLGFSAGRLFVEKHFDLSNRKMAKDMVREIKNAFKRNLPETSWLDRETARIASEKVDAVRDAIGYPDSILNVTEMDAGVLELNISDGMSFFDMNLVLYKFWVKEALKLLHEPVDRDSWSMKPTEMNAYYNPASNEIVFPAGVLQPPAYKSDYPQSINFGGIGFVVGHELTHGFDNSGQKYDKYGNLHPWWQEKTQKEFSKKAQCLAQQYSDFRFFGIPINGNVTLAENIADNGGLRLAYKAYMNWKSRGEGKNDPLLPSLGYSHEQLFFISFGQVWCASDTLQHAKQFLVKTVHAPNSIRVLGSVMNMNEFSEAFQCPVGSKMNPKEKCVVW